MNAEAAAMIRKYGMAPLPVEGGFFAVTWRSSVTDARGRPSGSAILFLVTETDFSALHQLQTDEIWHFHAGDPAEVVCLDPVTRACTVTVLGPDPLSRHTPQTIARAGCWQGARLVEGPGHPRHGWTLFGCTLSPGFDEAEFRIGVRADLEEQFPEHAAVIRRLTRQAPGPR